MRRGPDEATIVLIDPRRKLVDGVPEGAWLSWYDYAIGDIREVTRRDVPTVRKAVSTGRYQSAGDAHPPVLDERRIFVLIDDVASWQRRGPSHPVGLVCRAAGRQGAIGTPGGRRGVAESGGPYHPSVAWGASGYCARREFDSRQLQRRMQAGAHSRPDLAAQVRMWFRFVAACAWMAAAWF
jgi:hypothetical protein